MGRSNKNRDENVTYWRSYADLLLGLMLVLLLILMLFALGIIERPDGSNGNNGEYTTEETETTTEAYTETTTVHTAGWSHGGGNSQEEPPEFENPYEFEGQETFDKSAVYVVVEDVETEEIIRKAGIAFELYQNSDKIVPLNTYYPEKISYNSFETRAEGFFYLPEKISLGRYYLKNITAPEGYDLGENTFFDVEETHDWDKPFIVTVKLSPSKNVVHIQTKDKATGNAVTGGSYQVVAKEDIITVDGTLRYKAGEIADTIVCDENGYGESKELYLGNYVITEGVIPFGYAKISDGVNVELKKPEENNVGIYELVEEKTTVKLILSDALESYRYLSGVKYEITYPNGNVNVVETNNEGVIEFTDLEKNAEYSFRQVGIIGDYEPDDNVYTFSVDSNGYVDGVEGQITAQFTLYGREMRAEFDVRGMFFGNRIKGKTITLEDEKGNVVREWTSSSFAEEINGLKPAKYVISVKGESKNLEVDVEDSVEVQSFSYKMWSLPDLIIILIVSVIVIITIVALLWKNTKKVRRGADE